MELFMRFAVTFLFINMIYSNASVKEDGNQSKRIRRLMGGNPASISDFPFMMAIIKNEQSYIASFSLITYETAIGAAHTIYRFRTNQLSGRVGNSNKFEGTRVKFLKRVIHPLYDGLEIHNDIALLILKHSVKNIPNVSPIALPRPNRRFVEGTAKMVGWGRITPNKTTKFLRQADIKLMDPQKWRTNSPHYVLTGFEIIQVSDTVHGLKGDSGSPLIYTDDQGRRIQIGVFCTSPGDYGNPDIFMSTSVFHNFIERKSKGQLTFY